MRPALPLALLLLALLAVPAAADGGRPMHVFRGVHPHRLHDLRNGASASFFQPYLWDWSDWSGAGPAAGPPGNVIVLNLAPAAAPAKPADGRSSVETTADGVIVIRGPGTRHTAP
jgi:hypothetical protein